MKDNTTDHLAIRRRIRAAGRPICISEDDGGAGCIPSDALLIAQTGGFTESSAIDWSGGTAITIQLIITSKLPNFAISGFGLETPWKNDSFHWLEDPLEIDGISRYYRFGGRDLPEFFRDEVLNHKADATRVYSRGESLKGVLLGTGFEPIPAQFRHGSTIPAFVIVYDQFGREYRSPVELWTDRSLARSRAPRKRSLLDHPDPITRVWRG